MKLNIVPARQGLQWVTWGLRTFIRQPLALTGLFFLFAATMSLLSLIPVLGNIVALSLLPAFTLGLMAATKEVLDGKFPRPLVMFAAFREGPQKRSAMMTLGALYTGGFLLVLGLTALFDGGKFAKLYMLGGSVTQELLNDGGFRTAAMAAVVLYLPLSMMFWHAPALVHWQGVTPVKSLFFSLVACFRNMWAFTLYGLAWGIVFMVGGMLVASIAALFGSAEAVTATLMPTALLMAAMFFSSILFTYRDCFDFSTGDTP